MLDICEALQIGPTPGLIASRYVLLPNIAIFRRFVQGWEQNPNIPGSMDSC